jgi:site-specific DNA recombinase
MPKDPPAGVPRAAVYARVSTEEQAQHGTSLADQVSRCRAYAQAQAWKVAVEYVDEGVSGAASSRPALDQLIAAVHEGCVDVIIVAKLDRLGRSMRHLAAVLGDLDDRNIRLVSVAEAFDSGTASGRLQRNILGSFAEFEREQIRERSTSGLAAVARQGFWPGGPPPYGFTSEPDEMNPKRTRLAVDTAEADVLRLAVSAVVDDGATTGDIAGRLNRDRIRPRKADQWNARMVRHLLLNLPLSGSWEWRRGTDAQGRRRRADGPPILLAVPALIDAATHERLRSALSDRTSGQRSTMRQRSYLLSRRVTSPHGAPMFGFPGHGYRRFYVCREGISDASPLRCDCHRVDADTLEDGVWGEIVALLSDPARLMGLASVALEGRDDQRATEVDQIRVIDRQIRRVEDALTDRLADLLAKGIDSTAVQRATAKLDAELNRLRHQREQLATWQAANQHTVNRAKQLLGLAHGAATALEAADDGRRRRLIDLLEIRVNIEGWEQCSTCMGKGLVTAPPSDRGLGHTGVVCPTCRRGRWLPRVVVAGDVPLEASGQETADVLPFLLDRPIRQVS